MGEHCLVSKKVFQKSNSVYFLLRSMDEENSILIKVSEEN